MDHKGIYYMRKYTIVRLGLAKIYIVIYHPPFKVLYFLYSINEKKINPLAVVVINIS